MPTFDYMLRKGLDSALLGYVLVVVGVLMVHTCVVALKDWALERPQYIPGVVFSILASLVIAALGGYIVYRAHH
jgi:hypothetical protein